MWLRQNIVRQKGFTCNFISTYYRKRNHQRKSYKKENKQSVTPDVAVPNHAPCVICINSRFYTYRRKISYRTGPILESFKHVSPGDNNLFRKTYQKRKLF